MKARFIIFISIVTVILGLASFYVGARFIAHSPWARGHSGAVWMALAVFILLQILGPYLYRVFPDHIHRLFVVHWAVYMTLGVFACVFFYTLVADLLIALLIFILGPRIALVAESWSFVAVGAMATASVVIGAVQVAKGPRVYEVEIPIENLPNEFDGFEIVQISDLHVGPTLGRAFIEHVVKVANDLAPDLIALTGDLIDGAVHQLRRVIEPLAQLRAKYGTFYVTGNHEYYWGVEEWIAEFRRLGARVLVNEHAVIRKDGAELVIAGVTDDSAAQIVPDQASDVAKAIAGAPDHAIKILLSHRPSGYKKAVRAGFHLQLSGHTHGGQFFPWSLIVALAFRYGKGLHRYEKFWIYVSRGTGYWGPPLRFGVPPEITLLRLKRA